MKHPLWYEEQLKLPLWLSVALMFHQDPKGKWTDEKQKLGEELTKGIKDYSKRYAWGPEVEKTLFDPKFPEDHYLQKPTK